MTINKPNAYPTLQAFYLADPRRVASPEADYGVWWIEGLKRWLFWRVSYVRDTGEIYAVQRYASFQKTQDRLKLPGLNRVEVLGVVPPDQVQGGEIWYRTLDEVLKGWADRCGQPYGLAWVRERLETRKRP